MTSSWLLWCVPCCSGNLHESVILLNKHKKKKDAPPDYSEHSIDLRLQHVEDDDTKVIDLQESYKSWKESDEMLASSETSTIANSDSGVKSKTTSNASTLNSPDALSGKKISFPWKSRTTSQPEDHVLFTVPNCTPRSATLPRLPSVDKPIKGSKSKVSSRSSDNIADITYGTVWLMISTEDKYKKLHIYLERLEGLPALGENETYTTRVKLDVLPSEKHVKQSKTVKGSLSPEFDEHFVIPFNDQNSEQYLRVTVVDTTRQGKYDAIGYALYILKKEKLSEEPQRVGLKLGPQSVLTEGVAGKLLLSLTYQPSQDKVSLVVMQAKDLRGYGHLKSATISDKIETYCKITLMSHGEKIQTMKTKSSKTRSPFYNQSYPFCIRKGQIEYVSIVIAVMVKGLMKKSEPLGRVVLGPYQVGEDSLVTHWGKVIRTREVVTQWHNLYL